MSFRAASAVLAALACVMHAGAAELPPTPEGDTGIASRYPMDAGIAADPKVIFASGFENKYQGWTRPGANCAVSTDKQVVHSGKACSEISANRGKDEGSSVTYKLPGGRGVDRLHLRFYCKFHVDTVMPHHFVKLRGMEKGRRYPTGAGKRPKGNQCFSAGIEPGVNRDWGFYAYWHQMKSWQGPRGTSFYGNNFRPPQKPFEKGVWLCVEAMLKTNTIGKKDGEFAFWVDGKKVGHWRTGEPQGRWWGDSYRQDPNPKNKPFEGFDFRTDPELKVSEIQLQWYVSHRVVKQRAKDPAVKKFIVYFDDVVVATDYIGPMVKKTPKPKKKPGGGAGGAGAADEDRVRASAEKEAGRLYSMARQAGRMGQREVARRLYEQIIEKYPTTEMAKKARAKL